MASLQSVSVATPSPAASKGYDPEIKDIADYVHNKAIDSDLAVSDNLDMCPVVPLGASC
jgi:2-methylcitrate dehydratase